MELKPVNPTLGAYLHTSAIINWQHPDITKLAQQLADPQKTEENTANNCFLWVRDHIQHSWGFQLALLQCCIDGYRMLKSG